MRGILPMFSAFTLGVASWTATAASPQQIQQAYASEATRQQPGFAASATRGGIFFRRQFAVSANMPACTACHGDNPALPGRHVVTGKEIRPLAPQVNPERFADAAKVEKWFGRNCKEVVGRPCTPGEKADVMQFLAEAR